MNADSNEMLGMQQRHIAVLIYLLDSEILALLYEVEGNYIVQHYSIIFKVIS